MKMFSNCGVFGNIYFLHIFIGLSAVIYVCRIDFGAKIVDQVDHALAWILIEILIFNLVVNIQTNI